MKRDRDKRCAIWVMGSITFLEYVTWDTDGDGTAGDDYYFIFRVQGVKSNLTGSQIEVRPSGILRQTYS